MLIFIYHDTWENYKIYFLDSGVFVDFTETKPYNESNTSLYIALKNPFRYRSYYYDTETSLYYLNSRYYDPEIGRFINIDDISIINESKNLLNGLNLYIYCNDNPVMYTDTTGDAWWHWLIGAIIIIAAAALTVITAGGFAAAGAAFAGALGIGSAVGGAAGFFAAATVGATIGATISGVIGGISSVVNGENFWEGAANGFMWGAVSGFISGGLSFFKFGDIGSFGPKQQFNKLQIISQMLSNYAIYSIKTTTNNEKPTILGGLFALFGGIAGGFVAYLKLPEQLFTTIGLEVENLLSSVIKRIWKIPENIFV